MPSEQSNNLHPRPSNLSPSAEKVWAAICVNDEASEDELFIRCRPMSRTGLRHALAELVRGGLIVKDSCP